MLDFANNFRKTENCGGDVVKKPLKIFLIVIGSIIGSVILTVGLLIYYVIPRQYTTTDIANYGKYTGNSDNESVREFICSFFPQKIEEDFSDVTYSYRAQKNDTYAFEAYLSFTIEDPKKYEDFVDEYSYGGQLTEFRYDEQYQEHTIKDVFEPNYPESDEEKGISIGYAKIGKILFCNEKQEIIFIALGVYDGGMARTDFLTVFFDRFNIDPLEYAEHSAPDWFLECHKDERERLGLVSSQ